MTNPSPGPARVAAEADLPSAWDTAVSSSRPSHFRPDIEGLRAVAIGGVLLFHAGIPHMGGGFIGVDVFFVISGFLITGLLLREIGSSGRIDLRGFYARRARRLLPAALVVIAVTVVASYFILTSIDFPDTAVDGAAAALYVSNYRFALSATDYFAQGAPPSPLLHYWSLGVEEQFYLFWPVLILIGAKLLGIRRLWWLLGTVALGSFALSLWITNVEAPWAFYSLPTRAWQLALGGLIALDVLYLPRRFGWRAATVVGTAGLALIVGGVLLIDDSVPFPGFAALVPAAGAALLIVSGERAGALPARVLATRPMRWVGRISYSLYLWHWPILILGPQLLHRHGLGTRIALACGAIVVAELSTRFIEAPFRFGVMARLASGRSLAAAASMSAIVAIGSVLASGELLGSTTAVEVTPVPITGQLPAMPAPLFKGSLPADMRARLRDASQDRPDACQLSVRDTVLAGCVRGDPNGPTTVAVYGDSHATQWVPAIEELASQRHWRVIVLTKSSCPVMDLPVWSRVLSRPYTECEVFRQDALQKLRAEHPAIVFVSQAHGAHVLGDDGSLNSYRDVPDLWRDGLARTLQRVAQLSDRVVLLADTPRNARNPLECLARAHDVKSCGTAGPGPFYATIEASAAASAHVELLSLTPWLCPKGGCPLVMGSYFVYHDGAHLTASFVRDVLTPVFAWQLDRAAAVPSAPAR